MGWLDDIKNAVDSVNGGSTVQHEPNKYDKDGDGVMDEDVFNELHGNDPSVSFGNVQTEETFDTLSKVTGSQEDTQDLSTDFNLEGFDSYNPYDLDGDKVMDESMFQQSIEDSGGDLSFGTIYSKSTAETINENLFDGEGIDSSMIQDTPEWGTFVGDDRDSIVDRINSMDLNVATTPEDLSDPSAGSFSWEKFDPAEYDGTTSDETKPDGTSTGGDGTSNTWSDPQVLQRGNGWTIYGRAKGDSAQFAAVKDMESLQPNGSVDPISKVVNAYWYDSKNALTSAFEAWRSNQTPEGDDAEQGWSQPTTVKTIGRGWSLVRQVRKDGSEERYTAVMNHDGMKYYITPSGVAKPFSAWDDARWYSSSDSVASALKRWAKDDPGKTEQAWSRPQKITEAGGYFVYRQTRGEDVRYFVATRVSGSTAYLSRNGRYSDEPVFYAKKSSIQTAIRRARDLESDGSQKSPDGREPSSESLERTRTAGGKSGFANALDDVDPKVLAAGLVVAIALAYIYYTEQ